MAAFEENFPRTFAVLEDGIRAGLHLGAGIFIALDQNILADTAIGENRPGELLTSDAILPWLSSGKPLTAVAVAQMQEQGWLDWDDFVARFIPEFAQLGKEPITIRQLLTHTGGFRAADKIPADLSWEETIAAICATPIEPGWFPGEKAGYHVSSSWFILAEILRRLDGRSFEQYLRDEILLPCGMTHAWNGMPAEAIHRDQLLLGMIYRTDRTPAALDPFLNSPNELMRCRPGSNARGRVSDLGLFYEMLLQHGMSEKTGRRVLRPETVDALTTRRRIGLFDQTFQHVIDWGMGFMVNSNRHGAAPYGFGAHASEETFGHSGSQSSCAFADPPRRLVVAWMCNGMPGERRHQQRARALNTAIYEDLGWG